MEALVFRLWDLPIGTQMMIYSFAIILVAMVLATVFGLFKGVPEQLVQLLAQLMRRKTVITIGETKKPADDRRQAEDDDRP